MNDMEISVSFNIKKLKALQHELGARGLTVESVLRKNLTELYTNMVPLDIQNEVNTVVRDHKNNGNDEKMSRHYISAFRIVRDGNCTWHEATGRIQFIDAARLLRLHMQNNMDIFSGLRCWPMESLEQSDYGDLIQLYKDGAETVAGVYEYDFDNHQMRMLDPECGWRCFQMRDVSTAIYYADKSDQRQEYEKRLIFLERLEGKEFPPDNVSTMADWEGEEAEAVQLHM